MIVGKRTVNVNKAGLEPVSTVSTRTILISLRRGDQGVIATLFVALARSWLHLGLHLEVEVAAIGSLREGVGALFSQSHHSEQPVTSVVIT